MRRKTKLLTRLAIVGVAAGLLAGCAGDYDADAIREAQTSERRFDRALGEAYLRYAATERSEADWRDAQTFADRAAAAFAGAPPSPELVESRDLAGVLADEAVQNRAALTALLDRGVAAIAPTPAAEAQAAYDCWIQEAEEAHQTADIDACLAAFSDALALLANAGRASVFVLLPPEDGGEAPSAISIRKDGAEAVLDKPLAAATATPGSTPEQIAPLDEADVTDLFGATLGATPEKPRQFVLYFEPGTSVLTPESAALLPEVVAETGRRTAPRVAVVGHSDRVGRAALNERLSRNRAQSVADLLIESGLAGDAVAVDSFGEADNAVPTADEVAEPLNRRVEVTVL